MTVEAADPAPGTDEDFTLVVNGASSVVQVPRGTTLLEVLRNDLGLRGSKFGCGQGQCGACFVLVDGHPTPSCQTPVEYAVGADIRTVEGIGTAAEPHPVQVAFLERQAGQCGYCLSGILISSVALLESEPRPTRDRVTSALDRHLCRCGSQQRFIDAVLAAGELAP